MHHTTKKIFTSHLIDSKCRGFHLQRLKTLQRRKSNRTVPLITHSFQSYVAAVRAVTVVLCPTNRHRSDTRGDFELEGTSPTFSCFQWSVLVCSEGFVQK